LFEGSDLVLKLLLDVFMFVDLTHQFIDSFFRLEQLFLGRRE